MRIVRTLCFEGGNLGKFSYGKGGDRTHNAFTDLKFHGGSYYLAFRTASYHLFRDGEIRVMRSKGTKEWTEMAFPKMTPGDMRDPHFFEKGGFLGMVFPFVNGGFTNAYVSYLLEDDRWSEPEMFQADFVPCRPFRFDGKLFIPGFHHGQLPTKTPVNKSKAYGCALQAYGSQALVDCIGDPKVGILQEPGFGAEIIDADPLANETELFVCRKELYAICRRETKTAALYRRTVQDGVTAWKMDQELPVMIQAPCIKEYPDSWGAAFLVAGREAWAYKDYGYYIVQRKDREPVPIEELSLWIMGFIGESMTFREPLTIVKGAYLDCGYAGMEKYGRNFLVSYYAGNGKCSEVRIAEVSL